MVHVAHDGNDRRARSQILSLILDVELHRFDLRVHQPAATLAFFNLKAKAILSANLLGLALVNRLIDILKNAHLHQISDNLKRLLLELVR